MNSEQKANKTVAVTVPTDADGAGLFVSLISQGVEAWMKAGAVLVQMVDKNRNAFEMIMYDYPQISIDVLVAFERIGRKQLYPYLLLDNSPGSRRLLNLPYGLQAQYYKASVDVITGWDNGSPRIESKSVHRLTYDEAERAFSHQGVRDIEQQKDLFRPKASRVNTHRRFPRRDCIAVPSIAGLIATPKTKSATFRIVMDAKGELTLQRVEGSTGGSWVRLEIDLKTRRSEAFELSIP